MTPDEPPIKFVNKTGDRYAIYDVDGRPGYRVFRDERYYNNQSRGWKGIVVEYEVRGPDKITVARSANLKDLRTRLGMFFDDLKNGSLKTASRYGLNSLKPMSEVISEEGTQK